MNHPGPEEWGAYLYGELAARKRVALEAHLVQCPECKANVDLWRRVMAELDTCKLQGRQRRVLRLWRGVRWAARHAVAAVLILAVGYGGGRLSAPRALDAEQLQTSLAASLRPSLEAVIRQDLLEDLDRRWQLALAASHVQLGNDFAALETDLRRQCQRDLNALTVRALALSDAATNELLRDLIQCIASIQTHDRWWVTAVLGEMESSRLQDTSRFRNGLQVLAAHTGDEFQRTREDMARLLVYTQPEGAIPNVPAIPNTSNERNKP